MVLVDNFHNIDNALVEVENERKDLTERALIYNHSLTVACPLHASGRPFLVQNKGTRNLWPAPKRELTCDSH